MCELKFILTKCLNEFVFKKKIKNNKSTFILIFSCKLLVRFVLYKNVFS